MPEFERVHDQPNQESRFNPHDVNGDPRYDYASDDKPMRLVLSSNVSNVDRERLSRIAEATKIPVVNCSSETVNEDGDLWVQDGPQGDPWNAKRLDEQPLTSGTDKRADSGVVAQLLSLLARAGALPHSLVKQKAHSFSENSPGGDSAWTRGGSISYEVGTIAPVSYQTWDAGSPHEDDYATNVWVYGIYCLDRTWWILQDGLLPEYKQE